MNISVTFGEGGGGGGRPGILVGKKEHQNGAF